MLVRRAEMLPLECIVRGRLAGQAYDEYVADGHRAPDGRPRGLAPDRPVPEPIFTPSTKADGGSRPQHRLDAAAEIVGARPSRRRERSCLGLFRARGGSPRRSGSCSPTPSSNSAYVDGGCGLCDEVVTPDSSRIWPADQVRSGEVPPSFDKQPFRDWLNKLGWDRTPPPPPVPDEVVAATAARYVEAYERVTGRSLVEWYGVFPVIYAVVVDVTLREGIADPEGSTIERALPALGFRGVCGRQGGQVLSHGRRGRQRG